MLELTIDIIMVVLLAINTLLTHRRKNRGR